MVGATYIYKCRLLTENGVGKYFIEVFWYPISPPIKTTVGMYQKTS